MSSNEYVIHDRPVRASCNQFDISRIEREWHRQVCSVPYECIGSEGVGAFNKHSSSSIIELLVSLIACASRCRSCWF